MPLAWSEKLEIQTKRASLFETGPEKVRLVSTLVAIRRGRILRPLCRKALRPLSGSILVAIFSRTHLKVCRYFLEKSHLSFNCAGYNHSQTIRALKYKNL